ncbi:MAG: hypothetical protein M3Q58_12365, partial [Bacteroidota bacterium]|nr:hypothetical protein [Bacteroidota bacterium]
SGASISVTPAATTTYFVRAEGTCNTTTCASVTVTVSSNSTAPTSASASPATICPGGSSNLTVNGGSLGTGASWQWFSTSCGGISVGSGASISVTPAATTTYFVRAEGTCNTSACVSVTVTVSSNSTAPTSATASAATICSGNSSTLTVNGGSLGVGASWEWYSASCGGTAVGSGSSVTVSPTATTTYFVRAVGACNTTSCVSVTVTVDQNSTAPTSATASPTAICPGGSSTLTVNGGSLGTGASWQWYSTSCGGTAVGSGATILVSPTTTTTYFVRAEGTCNNTICQSVAVTVNSLSTDPTSISASATTICEGNSTTLTVNGGSTGTGANWEWYSSTCGGSIVGSGASITVSPTTTTTYFVRAVGTCNTSLCTNITINVESNSVAATSANATPAILCNGNSTTLTLSGGSLGTAANWEWYSGSCGGTPVGSGASVSISPTATTTYFVRAEGTCNNTICQSITVTVNTLSTDPTAANATPLVICDGNSSTLTVTGGSLGTGANWEWFSGSCAGTAVGTGTSISVSPTSTTTYFVRSEGTCNNTLCEQVTVTVESLSTDPISITESASSVCTGNSVTLTVNGGTLGTGADWEWYSGSCNGTPVGTGSSVTLTVTGNTTYFVNAVGSCNTTNCVQTTITTIPGTTLPTTLTPSTNPVCPGDVVTITMTGEALEAGANWAWYSGSCGGTSEGTGNSLTVNPTITTTYFVRAEGGSCGNSACESIIVNVNTESTAVSSIDATSNSVCAGSSVTLDALGGTLGTGADYQWFEASCNSTVIGNGQSITVNPTVVTTYFVNITGACNTTLCEEIQINMEVANIAANSVIASSTNLCESSNITLTVDGGQLGSGADWEWYDDNCSGTIIGTGNSINVSPGVPTTYYVAATGGCNTTTCVSVDIQANPIPAAWTIPSGNFCATDPAYDLSTWLNTGTLTNGIWYGSGVSASTFDPSGLSGNIEIAYVTGSGICLDSVAQTIEILEGPIAPIVTSSGDSICAGSAVVLNASGSGTNSTYQVYSIVGGSPLGTTPLTVNPATTTSYNIVAVDTNGCANVGGAVSVTIVASQPPDINAGSDTETCLGSSVILSASSSGSITWSTGENLASISVSPLINTVYYATALENGCSNSDSVAVQIITSSYITATNDSVITDQPVT